MRYLDPKNDLTFKKVFGQHPHLLRSFLNALIPLKPGQQIVSLQYLPTELVPDIPALKHSIVDVRCTDNFNRQFIVEMQMLWTDSFKTRILFNASKAYVKQLEKGKEYKSLNPVFALSLVNEDFEKDTTEFYHHYSLVHSLLENKKLEGLEFVFVELPKFKAQNLTDKRMQVLWLRYLAEIETDTQTLPADLMEVPEIREALQLLQESAYSRDELAVYDQYWDGISSEKTLLEGALQEGKEIGMQEGKEIGMQEAKRLGVVKALQRGKLSLAEIAEDFDVDALVIIEIQATLQRQ